MTKINILKYCLIDKLIEPVNIIKNNNAMLMFF